MFNWGKHKFNMLRILKDIYTHPQLGNYLGFKGGTACHFFYNLPRYSVDLDFDLLNKSQENFVFEEIKKIFKKYSQIKIKEARIKHFTIFFLLSYSSKDYNIKIEISRRPIKNNFIIQNYLGIPMRVIKKEDALADKLVALTTRRKTAMRDLFDIHYFLSQNWDINKKLIEIQTGKSLKEYLKDCIQFIEKISNKEILSGLGELVDEKQKIWIKNKLKEEAIFLIKVYLENA